MNTETLPIHTVTARWGANSTWEYGGKTYTLQYEPDWKVLWVQPTGEAEFPWMVFVRYNAGPGMTNPIRWRVPDLDDPRYDFSEAVALPFYAGA